ncbi:pilin [Herbaspirillum sp. RTI4]|uniref:pilin n=1 Tax=Herbaspirillum sp. RTI4 TaxID=3048640 RepID=UPI002AB483AD|nr:pilin [Herbaspirillum sp. RTI4]MDY7576807.1 pilin [Herbaspirillum sp. RTI4]MEA9981403.1 pilin [Herbaspirillum sp. RTI4]
MDSTNGADKKEEAPTGRRIKGFTLIELMVVLGIIGLLASFAIPQYRNYMVRTRVVEGLNLASGAKLAVAEAAQAQVMGKALTAAQVAYTSPESTPNVESIAVGEGGVVTITYKAGIGDVNVTSPTLTLVPTFGAGAISWQCVAAGVAQETPAGSTTNTLFAAGTLPKQFAPANCRGA